MRFLALAACALASSAAAQQPAVPHWAFVAPVRPPVPAVAGEQPRNPIDAFVQARLQREGLAMAAPASRGELLRRVTFDLTGLPPTLDELDAFERDPRPDAYEQVVDALLASDAAAEESTRIWLDLCRYADTHGMQRDQERTVWPFRDFVLDACRRNLPFDQFVTWQLAGDLLPDATLQQRIASSFNRQNPTSDEGGLIPDEYLARYAMNRTDTFGTVFLGLSVGCAQCHDHKHDPITQRDYYRLLACFASFAEEGNDGGAAAPVPAIAAPTAEQAQRLADLERRTAAAWRTLLATPDGDSLPWHCDPDGVVRASGPVPERGAYVLTVTGDFAGLAALRVLALPDDALPARGPGRADNGNFVLTEVQVLATDRDSAPPQRVALAAASAPRAQPGHPAEATIDGNPDSGWALHTIHQATPLHLQFAAPLPPGTTRLEVHLRHDSRHKQHLLGCFALAASNLAEAIELDRELEQLRAAVPQCMVSGERAQPRAVHVLHRGRYDQPLEAVPLGTPAFLPGGTDDRSLIDRLALARWLCAPEHPLFARVAVNRIWQRHFGRGLVATPHDFGTRGSAPTHPELLDWLACEFLANGWDERRLHRLIVTSATYRTASRHDDAAARDPDNRLLARHQQLRLPAEAIRDQALAVAGLLVRTFGGPSVKPPQPPGIWESVTFTGSNTEHYVPGEGDARHRRSVYTFWKRTAPPAFLSTFDAPSREQCTVERGATTTPLQALALWNDENLREAARQLGARAIAVGGDDEARIGWLFRTLLQRGPDGAELAAMRALLAALRGPCADEPAVWAHVATTMFSFDPVLHR